VLQKVADKAKKEQRHRELLYQTYLVTLAASPAPFLYTGDLSSAQAAGLATYPPFRSVSLPGREAALWDTLIDVTQTVSDANDYYSVNGSTLKILTGAPVTVGTTQATIVGFSIPTLANLPNELQDDFVDLMLERVATSRQQGARING
jgi:hypothetical protein